jgi:hypothetical protein
MLARLDSAGRRNREIHCSRVSGPPSGFEIVHTQELDAEAHQTLEAQIA